MNIKLRYNMIDKWKRIYHDNDVCMNHLLVCEEANELTEEEKKELLIWAGEE